MFTTKLIFGMIKMLSVRGAWVSSHTFTQ